jgi:hypothetical protein
VAAWIWDSETVVYYRCEAGGTKNSRIKHHWMETGGMTTSATRFLNDWDYFDEILCYPWS